MKRLRTLVVVHSTLVPPDSLEGHSEKDIEEWRTEYDVVSTLKKSGHEVRCLGISDSVEELRSVITEWKPEMVFNLLEEFGLSHTAKVSAKSSQGCACAYHSPRCCT